MQLLREMLRRTRFYPCHIACNIARNNCKCYERKLRAYLTIEVVILDIGLLILVTLRNRVLTLWIFYCYLEMGIISRT